MQNFEQPQVAPETTIESQIAEITRTVETNADRVAKLGEWPPYIQPGSLLERIPKSDVADAPGFDAGIACALNLIPADKQELSARLHAAYTKQAVEQVRAEIAQKDPESQTTWWLAACSVCNEGGVNREIFIKQLGDFTALASAPEAREKAAEETFEKMTHAFTMKDGTPYGEEDGCIQGAYIAGHPFGSMYSKEYGLYFIGTYEGSLGLEDFAWSSEKDEKGRDKSGPVFGSRQFVKCASEDEWKRAIAVVKAHLA